MKLLKDIFARKQETTAEPEAPPPPIQRYELWRNDVARMYLDVNPGVGFSFVVADRWPTHVQPWLGLDETQGIIRRADDIINREAEKIRLRKKWDSLL